MRRPTRGGEANISGSPQQRRREMMRVLLTDLAPYLWINKLPETFSVEEAAHTLQIEVAKETAAGNFSWTSYFGSVLVLGPGNQFSGGDGVAGALSRLRIKPSTPDSRDAYYPALAQLMEAAYKRYTATPPIEDGMNAAARNSWDNLRVATGRREKYYDAVDVVKGWILRGEGKDIEHLRALPETLTWGDDKTEYDLLKCAFESKSEEMITFFMERSKWRPLFFRDVAMYFLQCAVSTKDARRESEVKAIYKRLAEEDFYLMREECLSAMSVIGSLDEDKVTSMLACLAGHDRTMDSWIRFIELGITLKSDELVRYFEQPEVLTGWHVDLAMLPIYIQQKRIRGESTFELLEIADRLRSSEK
jgi:hypothetical protein